MKQALTLLSEIGPANNDGSLYVMRRNVHLVESDPSCLFDDLPANVHDDEETDVDV